MALRRGVVSAATKTLPTCNPCQEGDHGRCATALGPAHLGVIDTDFECACYRGDVVGHQTDADERQEQHFERDDYGPRQSSYREYERWAEEM